MDLRPPSAYRPWLRLGTCSWKYDSWKGLIYEPTASYRPHDYLPDYARSFDTVEVDQWFWSLFPGGIKLPEPETVRSYTASVGDEFIFSVKAPNSITLTHFYAKQPKALASWANQSNRHFLSPELLARFLESLSPLGAKLGPVMFQFVYLNTKKMASLDALIERLGAFFDRAPAGFQYAVECRNPNYLRTPFFDFLKDRQLGFVFLQGYYMPPIREVFEAMDTVTADFVVIRLHGGDRQDIEARTGGVWNRLVESRDGEIADTAELVREFSRQEVKTFLYVNNHFEGSAPLTAHKLLKRLE
jgi:uncharacterized protein YecE (DUF72 family)